MMKENFELKFDDDSTEKVSIDETQPDNRQIPTKAPLDTIRKPDPKTVEISEESAFKTGVGVISVILGIIVTSSVLYFIFRSPNQETAQKSKTNISQTKTENVFEEKAKKEAVEEKEKLSTNTEEYKVKSGDTLYGIAIQYDISSEDIIKLNDLKPPYTLRTNQTLLIPLK